MSRKPYTTRMTAKDAGAESLRKLEVFKTPVFAKWHDKLAKKNIMLYAIISDRLELLEKGNFGDHKNFDGMFELRIFYSAGIRLYGTRKGDTVVIMMCGGDKDSQARDIQKAKAILEELKNDYEIDKV
ncbi:hypothetical protein FACS1894186_4210 [Alphaproteobacteria bacterium]|nr:hypothetical protein FACS1894186_4210 [Alphaproteobacteria bacterium]